MAKWLCLSCIMLCLSHRCIFPERKSIIMRPSPDCSPAMLVAHTKCEPSSLRSRSLRASYERRIGKSQKIWPMNHSHSLEGSSEVSGSLSAIAWASCYMRVFFSVNFLGLLKIQPLRKKLASQKSAGGKLYWTAASQWRALSWTDYPVS